MAAAILHKYHNLFICISCHANLHLRGHGGLWQLLVLGLLYHVFPHTNLHAGDTEVISLDSEEEDEDNFMTFLQDLDTKRDHRRKRAGLSTHTHPIAAPTRHALPATSNAPLGQLSNPDQPSIHVNPIARTARAPTNIPSEGNRVETARSLHDFFPSLGSLDPDQDLDMLMAPLPLGNPPSPHLEMFSPPQPKRQRLASLKDGLGGDNAIPVLAGSSLQDEVDKMSASDAARMFRQDAAQRLSSKAVFRPRDSGPFTSIYPSDAELVDGPSGIKARDSSPSNSIHPSDAELVDVPSAQGNVFGHSIAGRHVKPAEQAAAKGPLFKHIPNRVWDGVKKANLTGRTFPHSGARPSQTGAPGNDKRADDMALDAIPEFDAESARLQRWPSRASAQQPKRMRATGALSHPPSVLNDDGLLPERAPELDSDGELVLDDGVEMVDTAPQAAPRPGPAATVQAARDTTKSLLVASLARRRAARSRMLLAPKGKGPEADNITEAQLVASQDALTQKAEAIDLTMDLAQVGFAAPLTPAVERRHTC